MPVRLAVFQLFDLHKQVPGPTCGLHDVQLSGFAHLQQHWMVHAQDGARASGDPRIKLGVEFIWRDSSFVKKHSRDAGEVSSHGCAIFIFSCA